MKKLILLTTIILVGLATFFYVNSNNDTKQETSEKQPQQSVSDSWVKNINKDMGISVYHPKEFTTENISRYSFQLLDSSQQAPTGNVTFAYFSYIPVFDENVSTDIYNANYQQIAAQLELQIGESKNVTTVEEFKEWYTYTRLPDQTIGNKKFRVYENTKPWEFPGGTTETRYLAKDGNSVYLLGFYANEEGSLNKELAMQIINTATFSKPDTIQVEIEKSEIKVPAEWKTYEDVKYKISMKHAEDWKITPAPVGGIGGVIRIEGTNNGEKFWVDMAQHETLKRMPNETLRELELRRSPSTKFDSEKMLEINGLEVYQQIIPIIYGGGAETKKYGIYNLFELDGKIFFLEFYTNQPNEDLKIVSTILAGLAK